MVLTSEVEPSTILRGVVGSTAHGLAIDGQDDLDEMGVCIESLELAMGVGSRFEQHIFRTAAEREGKHDARSQPGDLDLTIYGLRKYLGLALKGNPTILILLYLPKELCLTRTSLGAQLQELAPKIVSRGAIGAFLGYLRAQEQRLKGERGTKTHRPELVARATSTVITAHGYNTKFAMHALRLGYQGLELANTGRLELPIAIVTRGYLRDVREGKVPLADVLAKIEQLGSQLAQIIDNISLSALPANPDVKAVNDWMLDVYMSWWKANETRPWPIGTPMPELVEG
jgi:predicted nucleotidyltransferase